MDSDHSKETPDSESLAPKAITNRFDSLEPGDRLTVNSHQMAYEVIETDTYSVIAKDPDGHRVTFSQNLQSGGWMFNEEIFNVETDTE